MMLEKFCNWVVSTQIKTVEKLHLGRSILALNAIPMEFFYGFYSKLNIINPPCSRYKRYIAEYIKNNPVDQQSEKPIAIVTGANSGIGYSTSKALMLAGFHVIFACRSKDLAVNAVTKIKEETNLENCEFMQLDLSSFEIMMCPYMKTKDGIEMQFGTNHVGHFILTNNLLDVLKRSAPARVINVASLGHLFSDTTMDEIKERVMDPSKYDKLKAYGNSKIANIMFSTILAKNLSDTGVVVHSLHPGAVNTELQRYATFDKNFIMNLLKKLTLLNPTAGSLTSVKLALSPEFENVSG
ncbi:hypothetical protein BB560_004243, partial [Smittium megazygosporum]